MNYATIGTDGTRLVVWGIGSTVEEAEDNACQQEGILIQDMLTLPCTDAARALVEAGQVACEGGDLELVGLRSLRENRWIASKLAVRGERKGGF